ncbi:hypothetical protein RHECNPAF_3500075 [Rhizobium etli CNPAF512]|nr:hypothetical protein RHECNPAF_3500075 [Rhizobium etli CNPAF512]
MTGIVAALIAHDDIRALRKPVDNLAFAFVTPLRTDHDYVRHPTLPVTGAEPRTCSNPRIYKALFLGKRPCCHRRLGFLRDKSAVGRLFPLGKRRLLITKRRGTNALASHGLYLPRHRHPLLGRQLRRRQARGRPYQPDDAHLPALVSCRCADRADLGAATQEGLADRQEKSAAAAVLRGHRLHPLQRHAVLGGAVYDGDQCRHRAGRHSHADLPAEFRLFPHRHFVGAMLRLCNHAGGRGADRRPWRPRHAAAAAAQPGRRADADRDRRLFALHDLPALETAGRLANADGLPGLCRHADIAAAPPLGGRPRRGAMARSGRLGHHSLHGDLPLAAGADSLHQGRRGNRRQPGRPVHQSGAGIRNPALRRLGRRDAAVLPYGLAGPDARRHRHRRKRPSESVGSNGARLAGGLDDLAKLQRRHAEDVFQWDRRSRPAIHPHGLEHRLKTHAFGKRDRLAVFCRNIDENCCAFRLGDQFGKQRGGAIDIIGKERADLVALVAAADRAVAADFVALAYDSSAPSLAAGAPGGKECFPRLRKDRRIIAQQPFQARIHHRMRNERRGRQRAGDAAIANGEISGFEAGPAVVLLLRGDAVETDRPAFRGGNPRFPDRLAVPFAAEIRVDDVETEKGKAVAIFDDRDRADRDFADGADEESRRIRFEECQRIVEAGIPSLLTRPFEHELQFAGPHRTNGKFRIHAIFPD